MHKVWQLVAILIQVLLHLAILRGRTIDRVDSAFNRYPVNLAGIANREAGDHGLWDLSVVFLLSLFQFSFLGSKALGAQSCLGSLQELLVFLCNLLGERS